MLATSSTAEPIRAETVRSGLVESVDEISGCIVDGEGRIVASFGDPSRPLFYRSAIKPFQAQVSIDLGADLPPEHLAVACASHPGYPVHLAIVAAILERAGLDETTLQTPPGWPFMTEAMLEVSGAGHRTARRIYYNCSGKHAGWLAACVAAGFDTATYLRPDHPLQQKVLAFVAEMTGADPEPVGVDGCGAPTLRGSCVGLARAFMRLGSDPDMARVRDACSRFPALMSGSDTSSGRLAQWWPGPMKGGAEGLLGCAGNGFAAAVKSHSGSIENATAAMGEMFRMLGLLSPAAVEELEDVLAQPVLGGGRPQGTIRMVLPTTSR